MELKSGSIYKIKSVDYSMNWIVGQGYAMSDKKKRYS